MVRTSDTVVRSERLALKPLHISEGYTGSSACYEGRELIVTVIVPSDWDVTLGQPTGHMGSAATASAATLLETNTVLFIPILGQATSDQPANQSDSAMHVSAALLKQIVVQLYDYG